MADQWHRNHKTDLTSDGPPCRVLMANGKLLVDEMPKLAPPPKEEDRAAYTMIRSQFSVGERNR